MCTHCSVHFSLVCIWNYRESVKKTLAIFSQHTVPQFHVCVILLPVILTHCKRPDHEFSPAPLPFCLSVCLLVWMNGYFGLPVYNSIYLSNTSIWLYVYLSLLSICQYIWHLSDCLRVFLSRLSRCLAHVCLVCVSVCLSSMFMC